MSEFMANFELERAARYGWKVGAQFYAPAPKRRKQARPGLVRVLGAVVRALFA